MCLDTLYRFIFNSDYPTDKIIYLEEGTITLTPTGSDPQSGGTGKTRLNVPQDRMPYVKGCISFDNWQSAIPFGLMRAVANGIVEDITDVHLDYGGDRWTGEVYIEASSYKYKSSTAKFRVWGLWAENDTGKDKKKNTAIAKTKLSFSTDNNYPRLIKDGIAKGGDTVAHNLGKIPYVDAWYGYYYGFFTLMERPSLVVSGQLGDNRKTMGVYADENNIYFGNPEGETHLYYYYRIYG